MAGLGHIVNVAARLS